MNTTAGVERASHLKEQTIWARLLQYETLLEYALLAVILLAAAGFRLYKLGDWSLWGDEAFSLSTKEDGLHYSIFRQSLAITLIRSVTAVWGNDEWTGRIVPALIGILTVLALYFPIRTMLGRNVAVLSMLFLAVSPWHLYWSQNARFYTLLLLFYSLGLLSFYYGFERDRPGYLLVALLLFGLAARESMTALFYLPVVILYLVILYFGPFERPPGLRLRNVLIFFAPAVVVGLLIVKPFIRNFAAWMAGFGPANNSPIWIVAVVAYYVGLPLIVLAVFGGLLGIQNRSRAALFFASGAFVPLFGIVLISPFHYTAVRYLFITLVPWVVLSALVIQELHKALQGRTQLLALAVLALVVVNSVSEDFLYFQYQNGNRPDWRSAIEYVRDNKQPGDVVVTTSPSVTEYYLKEKALNFQKWQPMKTTSPGSIWVIEDLVVEEYYPAKLAWLEANSQLVRNYDVHAQARNFKMRIYRYIPSQMGDR